MFFEDPGEYGNFIDSPVRMNFKITQYVKYYSLESNCDIAEAL